MDWERQNFSISQCVFSSNSQQNLVAIASGSSSSGSGSSTVGIAVGVTIGVVVLIAAAIAAFFLVRRRKRRQTGVAAAKKREDPSEKIRQGFAKGELDTGHDNQRYEMVGSDPNQAKPSDDHDSPGWVNEKANYPGDRSAMVEADDGGSGRAELGGPMASRSTVRPLHEMHDPSSQPRFELPAESPGELQGSTPSSSMPASPVSSTRRSAGRLSGRGLRSPFSKPTSPLSTQFSGPPHPSQQASSSTSASPSRSSFLGFTRLGGHRSSGPASSSEPSPQQNYPNQPSDTDRPMISAPPPPHSIRNHAPAGRSSDISNSTTSPRSNRGHHTHNRDTAFSPVSRRGTFDQPSGTSSSPYRDHPSRLPEDVNSPISPQSPDHQQQQGLWGRLRRS